MNIVFAHNIYKRHKQMIKTIAEEFENEFGLMPEFVANVG